MMTKTLIARKPRTYLEWGCGRSTSFYPLLVSGTVIAIDSYPDWCRNISTDPVVVGLSCHLPLGSMLPMVHARWFGVPLCAPLAHSGVCAPHMMALTANLPTPLSLAAQGCMSEGQGRLKYGHSAAMLPFSPPSSAVARLCVGGGAFGVMRVGGAVDRGPRRKSPASTLADGGATAGTNHRHRELCNLVVLVRVLAQHRRLFGRPIGLPRAA